MSSCNCVCRRYRTIDAMGRRWNSRENADGCDVLLFLPLFTDPTTMYCRFFCDVRPSHAIWFYLFLFNLRFKSSTSGQERRREDSPSRSREKRQNAWIHGNFLRFLLLPEARPFNCTSFSLRTTSDDHTRNLCALWSLINEHPKHITNTSMIRRTIARITQFFICRASVSCVNDMKSEVTTQLIMPTMIWRRRRKDLALTKRRASPHR